MKWLKIRLCFGVIGGCVAAVSAPTFAQSNFGAEFEVLGDLAGGGLASAPLAISRDGQVVVGWSVSGAAAQSCPSCIEAFRWTPQGGMQGLGDRAGGVFSSRAAIISSDGAVIGVEGNVQADGTRVPLRWTLGGGLEEVLSDWYPGDASFLAGFDANGNMIATHRPATLSVNAYAFIGGQRVALADLDTLEARGSLAGFGTPLTCIDAIVTSVSTDGRYVYGNNFRNNANQRCPVGAPPTIGPQRIALGTGSVALYYAFSIEPVVATDASADVVLTTSARVDTATGQYVGYFDNLGSTIFSFVDISDDARICVAADWRFDLEASVWTRQFERQRLASVLEAGGATVTLSQLKVAAISGDGNWIIGSGVLDEEGNVVAFRARLPFGYPCDSIDFNSDGSIFDPLDVDAFFSVFSEGPCIPAEATCGDVDFNNDGSQFDVVDIEAFLSVFAEGPCL